MFFRTKLDGPPDFVRGMLVEQRVKTQSGAAPDAGRGGEAERGADSHIRMMVEELFV